MEEEKFANALIHSIIEDNMKLYYEVPNNAEIAIQQPELLRLCNCSTEIQKRLLYQIIEQVIIDTISNFLGILDGSSYCEGFPEDFHLTYGENKEGLNGCLQDYFLGAIQEIEKKKNNKSLE